MSDLQTLVAQEVAKQLAAITADQTTKKVLEFLKNRNSADAYVVETWKSGSSWYRVWSDGFIEQGGYHDSSTSDGTLTVSFHKAYATTPYVGLAILSTDVANNFPYCNSHIATITTTKFTKKYWRVQGGVFYWCACGY